MSFQSEPTCVPASDLQSNYWTSETPLLASPGHNLPLPRVTTILTSNNIELKKNK